MRVFLGSYVARVVLAAKHCEQAECDLADALQRVTKLDEANAKSAGLKRRLGESQSRQLAQAVRLAQGRERLMLFEEERSRYEQQAEKLLPSHAVRWGQR